MADLVIQVTQAQLGLKDLLVRQVLQVIQEKLGHRVTVVSLDHKGQQAILEDQVPLVLKDQKEVKDLRENVEILDQQEILDLKARLVTQEDQVCMHFMYSN